MKLKITDIGLIILSLMMVTILAYRPLRDENYYELLSNILFVIATVLFGIKGWILENYWRLKVNEPKVNFFEYYEIELGRLFKFKFNLFLFTPVIERTSTSELFKKKTKINIITISMYTLLIISIVIKNVY